MVECVLHMFPTVTCAHCLVISLYLYIAKVLVIQAGGYSQRFPSASVVGKAFVSYPVG